MLSFSQFIAEAGVKWVPGAKNWTSISGQKHSYHVEHRPLNSLKKTDITHPHRVKKLVDRVKKGGEVDMMEISPEGTILDGHHRHKMALKYHKPTDKVPVQVHTVSEGYVNFGDYNLEQKFHHYNQLLFQSQIPPCPITWATLPGKAGLTTFTKTGKYSRTIIPGSMDIKISNKFKRSEQELDSTLIHEMIHAFLATHGHPDENHGVHFQHLAKLCGEKVGIEIAITDKLMDMELAQEDRVLTTALLWSKRGGNYSAVFYNGTAFDDPVKQNQLKGLWGAPGKIPPGEEITVVKVMSGLMGKYGKKTDVAQAKWSYISDAEARDIFQHGQIMFKIQPNSVSHEDSLDMQQTKEMLCVFRTNTRTGDVFGSFYQPNIAKDPAKLQQLRDYWHNMFRAGYNVEIFTTKSVNYLRFTMMRDPKKGTFYNLKPNTTAEMRRNAHYLTQWIQ